jgi:hypothetical protein
VKKIRLDREHLYKKQFHLKDVYVDVRRLKPRTSYAIDAVVTRCSVRLKDIRRHPKWGPVVESLLNPVQLVTSLGVSVSAEKFADRFCIKEFGARFRPKSYVPICI